MPGHETIQWSNLKRVKAFYDGGGKVIATGRLPHKSAEFGHDEDVVRTIEAMFPRDARSATSPVVVNRNDRDGVAMLDGGGTLLVEGDGVNFAAAGHSDVIATGDMIYHFYHAYAQSNGRASLRIVEMPFDDEGWPVPGGP